MTFNVKVSLQSVLFILVISLLSACQTDPSEQAASVQSASPTEGTFLPPVAPDDSFEARLLTRNYWVFEYFVSPVPNSKFANKGRWYNFNADGTYVEGRWQEVVANGTWLYRIENGKRLLRVDSSIDELDNEYDIQGISGDEEAMSWVSTQRTIEDSEMIKVIQLLEKPTKKQFGVENSPYIK